MKVELAGYNFDAEIIRELVEKSGWNQDNITPETLSSSYARISRDPRDISKIRESARCKTDKARRSNRRIIFGMGHSSVAEHAVFNIDIMNISRIAVEKIQDFRFASFTEKSQRYIKLNNDFVIPSEISGSGFYDEFRSVIELQNNVYNSLCSMIKDMMLKEAGKNIHKEKKAFIEGRAREDSRYVLSLATHSQFGMTVNARSLEQMICYFAADRLSEVRELGKKLYDVVKSRAPSLIKYVEPSPYILEAHENLKSEAETICDSNIAGKESEKTVKLIDFTENADEKVCAALLFEVSGLNMECCMEKAFRMDDNEKFQLLASVFEHREMWDKMTRHFELPVFTFELILSATNYAQMKRHRISTQIKKSYNPELGVTLPESIKKAGGEHKFKEVIEKTEEFYGKLMKIFPHVASYVLTNAHRRRILLTLNLRELYHLSSLREDEHAQWDIRNTALQMRKLVQEKAPLSAIMMCGKSSFYERKKDILSSNS
ncbi:MAG: FAD-dependent thymidylate synthase [bacterium]